MKALLCCSIRGTGNPGKGNISSVVTTPALFLSFIYICVFSQPTTLDAYLESTLLHLRLAYILYISNCCHL